MVEIKQKSAANIFLEKALFLLVTLFLFQQISCVSSTNSRKTESSSKDTTADCINQILTQDSQYGTIRNHASEVMSLTQAIEQYIDSLNRLNFSQCPQGFTNAFQAHLDAWKNMQGVTDNYSNLRGEMHVLFDKIKIGEHKSVFEQQLKNIMDTWAEVEKYKKNKTNN